MFCLDEIKEYWVIVSVNDDKDDVRVLRVSPDIRNDEHLILCNGVALDDTSIDNEWYESWIGSDDTHPGVYKTTLELIWDSEDDGETKFFDYYKVIQVDTLYLI